MPRLRSLELKGLEGIKEELLIFAHVSFLVRRQSNTLSVSGVPHRSYFLRDLLIYTVVTFGHPVTDCYRRVKIDESK